MKKIEKYLYRLTFKKNTYTANVKFLKLPLFNLQEDRRRTGCFSLSNYFDLISYSLDFKIVFNYKKQTDLYFIKNNQPSRLF